MAAVLPDILTWDSAWQPLRTGATTQRCQANGHDISSCCGLPALYLIVVCGDNQNIVEIIDCSALIHLSIRVEWWWAACVCCTPAYLGMECQVSPSNQCCARVGGTTTSRLSHALSQLLLLGGQGRRKELYNHEVPRRSWSECGQLLVCMCTPSCTVLPSGELFVFGGMVEGVGDYSKQVWRGELQ